MSSNSFSLLSICGMSEHNQKLNLINDFKLNAAQMLLVHYHLLFFLMKSWQNTDITESVFFFQSVKGLKCIIVVL